MLSDGRLAPVELFVPLTPAAASAVRHSIADSLAGHVADRLLADAQLVLSELVTNSVRHAGLNGDAAVRVVALLDDGVLRLEVEDMGTTGAVAVREPSLGGGGFGLNLVGALARAWGVERDGRTRVWVELESAPAAH